MMNNANNNGYRTNNSNSNMNSNSNFGLSQCSSYIQWYDIIIYIWMLMILLPIVYE